MALRALPAVASMGSTFNEKLLKMAGEQLQYQHDKAVWDVWWKLLVVEHRRLVLLTLVPLLQNTFSIPHICHEPTSEARVNFFWPV